MSQNVNEILIRLKDFLDLKTDIELSRVLEVRPNTLSTWKQRNSLDYKLIIATCKKFDLDLNKVFLPEVDIYETPGTSRRGFTPMITKQLVQQYIKGGLFNKLTSLPQYNFTLGEGKENRAFQITSEILAPEIPYDSFAICDLTSLEEVVEDKVYVIISIKYGFLISKVKRSSEKSLMLINFQKTGSEESFVINQKNINEIWKVIGVSTYKPL